MDFGRLKGCLAIVEPRSSLCTANSRMLARYAKRAFSFIEFLIVMGVSALIVMGMASLLKSSSKTFEASRTSGHLVGKLAEIEQKISADIRNAIVIKSFCENGNGRNPLNLRIVGTGDPLTSCDQLRVKGGLIPFAGFDRDAISESFHFNSPTFVQDDALQTRPSDSLRMLVLDSSQTNLGCRLYFHPDVENPSPGVESVLVNLNDDPHCRHQDQGGVLREGKLYLAIQSFQQSSTAYSASALVHVTGLSTTASLSSYLQPQAYQVRSGAELNAQGLPASLDDQNPNGIMSVMISSLDSPLNLPGGLAHVGFRTGFRVEAKNNMRLLPAKVVEWSWEETSNGRGNLIRRELFRFEGGLAVEASDWEIIASNVEQFHLRAFSVSAQFGRSFLGSIGDSEADGLEDLMGLRTRIVLRGEDTSEATEFISNVANVSR